MYIMGDLSDTEYFESSVRIKPQITKEDLLKARDRDSQIIDLDKLSYYDADKNEWIKFKMDGE